MSYFAAALVRQGGDWTAQEIDLDEVEDLEALADLLRDLTGDGPGPAVLLLEADDEYVGLVRVDGGAGSLLEPRVFLSDRRAVDSNDIAALLWDAEGVDSADDLDDLEVDDDEDSVRPVVETAGDPALLDDLGISAEALLALCAEEGRLPADVLREVCVRTGCDQVLDQLLEV